MNETKEIILETINNLNNYKNNWNSIEEEIPDEFDLEMLKEIEIDSDCDEFISSEKVEEILGLR